DPKPEPPVTVVLGHVAPPLVERERRVRDDPVEESQLAAFPELRIADRVAPLDPRVGQPMEEHVHLTDRPGAEVFLLARERQVFRVLPMALEVVRAFDQHAARAARRIADAHASLRSKISTLSFRTMRGC